MLSFLMVRICVNNIVSCLIVLLNSRDGIVTRAELVAKMLTIPFCIYISIIHMETGIAARAEIIHDLILFMII